MLPNVVLMDMVMPDMDGITVTRTIRAAHPEMHVVILTGSKEDELVQEVLQAGAMNNYLAAIHTVFIEPQVIRQFDPNGQSFANINTPDDLARVRQWLTP
ncbi:MAG TPA: response regulator [Aggregatilineales bacterium]|nr:response regulator [Anaerolineales bacterium]HRE47936.1 response regulator [Aggregatilineales bacterium]